MKSARRNKNMFIVISMLILSGYLSLWVARVYVYTEKEVYQTWTPTTLSTRQFQSRAFVRSIDEDIYMYSAFVNIHREVGPKNTADTTEVIITTMGRSNARFSCCVIYSNQSSTTRTPAELYYSHSIYVSTSPTYILQQYSCTVPVPSSSLQPSYISLISSKCSTDIIDYLPVIHPSRVPGGIAVCGKIAHGGGLDPEKVIEWFEIQCLLGVDKVLILDMGNPDNITRVFKYYQALGILDLQPYELVGEPRNRTLQEIFKKTTQFNHDENLALFHCKQKLAGYDYISGHDLDELIIPRKNINLKQFVKEHHEKYPQTAGFLFHTEFFITTWEPTNPEEDLMVKRYRKSTVPRWECYKYVYLPSRVKHTHTHAIFPLNTSFTVEHIPPSEAILHHYRKCPEDSWGTCTVPTNIDNIMTRYQDLDERVLKVRKATSITPRWRPVQGTTTASTSAPAKI